MSTRPPSDQDTAARAKEELERTQNEAQQYARATAEEARERGREQLDRAKDRAADHAEDLADAIDETADRFDSDGDEAIPGYGHSMASMMRKFAGGLREHEIEEFAAQLATFARRNPASFLAGSVALGFGLSRFLKASSHGTHAEHDYDDDYDADDEEVLVDDASELHESRQAGTSSGSTFSTGEQWPEDRGNEGPGGASPAAHETPAVTQPASEYPPGATGKPAGSNAESGSGSQSESDNLGGKQS